MNDQSRPIRLTAHLRDALEERELPLEWVWRAIEQPDWVDPDPIANRQRLYRRIPEFGDRILRVIIEDDVEERVVVTVFFDRRAKRKPR